MNINLTELLSSMIGVIESLIELTEIVCVIVLLGYVVSRAKFFRAFLQGEQAQLRDQLLVAGIFGLFSIYGTIGGVKIGGAVLNLYGLAVHELGLSAVLL